MFDHPLHPLTVHFPIAFYLLGASLLLCHVWQAFPDGDRLAYGCFILSGLGAMVSSLAGIIDQNQLAIADPRRLQVDYHVTVSLAFMVINGGIVYLRFRWVDVLTRYRWAYLGLIVTGLLLLLTASWLGGQLVYTLGVGVQLE